MISFRCEHCHTILFKFSSIVGGVELQSFYNHRYGFEYGSKDRVYTNFGVEYDQVIRSKNSPIRLFLLSSVTTSVKLFPYIAVSGLNDLCLFF